MQEKIKWFAVSIGNTTIKSTKVKTTAIAILFLLTGKVALAHNPNLIMLVLKTDERGWVLLYRDQQEERDMNMPLDSAATQFLADLVIEINGKRWKEKLMPVKTHSEVILLSLKGIPSFGTFRIPKPEGRKMVCVSLQDKSFEFFREKHDHRIFWKVENSQMVFEHKPTKGKTMMYILLPGICMALALAAVFIANRNRSSNPTLETSNQ